MKEKSHMSLRTKKILAFIGISFGTVFAFLVSFIITFSLYINPIGPDVAANGDADADVANEEIKASEQKHKSDSYTYDKYTEPSKKPATVVSGQSDTPPETAKTDTSSAEDGQEDVTVTSVDTDLDENTEAPENNMTENTGAEADDEENSSFSPETITNTGEDTPEDVEAPITVIEITG